MDIKSYQKLLEIGKQLAQNRSLEPLLCVAMEVALQLVNAERGYLIWLTEDNSLEFRVRVDRKGQNIEKPDEQISHTILHEVINKCTPLVLADAISDEHIEPTTSITNLQLRSVMCVPLISRGGVLGAIYVENRAAAGMFNQDDLAPLEFLAAQVTVAIENAILNDELEQTVEKRTNELRRTINQLYKEISIRESLEAHLRTIAILDPDSNVFNRRHFFDLAYASIEHALRENLNLSILLIEIENLNSIAKQLDHQSGDQGITQIVECIKAEIRWIDILARYTAEKFVILFPDSSAIDPDEVAKKIYQALETCLTQTKETSSTVSLGLVHLTQERISPDELIHQADLALQRAKDEGDSRVGIRQDNQA